MPNIKKPLFLIIAISLLIAFSAASAAGAAGADADVIIVLDCSGSMKNTDPERVAVSGANLLLEQFDKSVTRCGVVMFGGEIKDVLPLQALSDEALIRDLKDAISSRYSQVDERTDTVRAVNRALQELENGKSGNKRAIVLFTDGDEDPLRSLNELNLERGHVIKRCGELGIPIYIIGLNADGSIAKEAVDVLRNTAESTGGKAYEISRASQIESTVIDIYRDFMGVRDDGSEEGAFTGEDQDFIINVPDPYILNINLNILSASSVTVRQVITPAPESADVIDDSNLVYTGQTRQRYTTVQLIQPRATGDWIVRLRGEKGIGYELKYVYSYTLIASQKAVGAEGGDKPREGAASLTGWLSTESGKVTDLRIYEKVKSATFEVVSASGKSITYKGSLRDDVFAADIGDLPAGDYDVKARFVHEHFDRESMDWLKITISPANPAADSTASASGSAASASTSASAPASDSASASTATTTRRQPAEPRPASQPPDGATLWFIAALIAAAALAAAAFIAYKLFIGPYKGSNIIKNAYEITVSDDNETSEVIDTGGYFYSGNMREARLSDIFGYFRVTGIGGREVEARCERILFIGKKNGVAFASRDRKIAISSSSGKIDGYPGLRDNEGGYIDINLGNDANTRIIIKKSV